MMFLFDSDTSSVVVVVIVMAVDNGKEMNGNSDSPSSPNEYIIAPGKFISNNPKMPLQICLPNIPKLDIGAIVCAPKYNCDTGISLLNDPSISM